jgi:hypothetical protein
MMVSNETSNLKTNKSRRLPKDSAKAMLASQNYSMKSMNIDKSCFRRTEKITKLFNSKNFGFKYYFYYLNIEIQHLLN